MLHEMPAWLRHAKYRTNDVAESILATLFFPFARRVMEAYLRRGPGSSSRDAVTVVEALASATGGGASICRRLDVWLTNECAARRWRPDDPESVDDLAEQALSELRAWMDEHPKEDPREEGLIEEIAGSFVPLYNYDRLNLAMASNPWLITGDIDQSASNVAELLRIAITKYIAEELYEEADRLMADREVTAAV